MTQKNNIIASCSFVFKTDPDIQLEGGTRFRSTKFNIDKENKNDIDKEIKNFIDRGINLVAATKGKQ